MNQRRCRVPLALVTLLVLATSPLFAHVQASEDTDLTALEVALLELSDLPDGWLESFPGEQGAYTTTRCGNDLTAVYPTIARQFKQSDLGPVLLHEIVLAPTGSGAVVMASVRERLNACPEWTTSQDQRPTLRWHATSLALPALAEESFASRAVAPFAFIGQATGDHVTMRVGDIFNLIGYASVGAHDQAALETFARLAAEKLSRTLNAP